MRLLLGITIGATLTIVAYTLWQPALAWALNNDQPATPHGWKPKMRTWINGELQ